jgi:hypothetical protein
MKSISDYLSDSLATERSAMCLDWETMACVSDHGRQGVKCGDWTWGVFKATDGY